MATDSVSLCVSILWSLSCCHPSRHNQQSPANGEKQAVSDKMRLFDILEFTRLFAVISRLFSKENSFLLCMYFNIRSYVNGRWGLWWICRHENMDFYDVCCQLIIKTVQKIYICCSSEFFYLFEVFHWFPGLICAGCSTHSFSEEIMR